MARDLLVEIGTEEIPARFIQDAIDQMADRVKEWLENSFIEYSEIKTFSTPRRLTVVVNGLSEKQKDVIEEVKGPPLKIAKDTDGNWSKAAQGFANSQELSMEDIYVKTFNNAEYIFAKKEFKGQEVINLLPLNLKQIIESMTFPKNMQWGRQELKFVRPIRWIVALYGDTIISFEVMGVKSGNTTFGHRFLGNEVIVSSTDKYYDLLKEQFVIADPNERRNKILTQIKALEEKNNWQIPIDEELLDEVVNLVEYPTVLSGSFKEEYLELPREVLVTTMKEHQRYFSVENNQGLLSPNFVTVRNGDDRSLEIVRKGNEKVLTARLADARFFFLEDQKLEINEALSKLEQVVFQENLGTIGDKIRRIKDTTKEIGKLLKLNDQDCKISNRTAEICKFDLVTNMVYEFPELQGLMGEKYANLHGEKELVAKGVYEHYLPRFSGDKLPETKNGQIVSIADKLDNIVGAFSLGKIPTGSQDPLGLRRQAAAIVQIILEELNELTLDKLFEIAISAYDQQGLLHRNKNEILKDLYNFFTLRINNLLQEKGIRYDVIDAILQTDKNNIKIIVDKAFIITKQLNDPSFKQIVDSFTRVINIANKSATADTDPKYYIEKEENELYNVYMEIKARSLNAKGKDQFLEQLKTLKEPIDNYFDKVMVMVDDQNLRQQRLGLLQSIAQLIQSFADFRKLVFA